MWKLLSQKQIPLNIPGNKAHSDSGLVGSLLQSSELSVSTPPLTADAYIPGEARRVLNEPHDIKYCESDSKATAVIALAVL